MNQPPTAYLFYSHKCANCAQIVELLKRYSVQVNPVNIHEIEKSKIPKEIRSVPTILVGDNILTGGDAFKWVQMKGSQQSQGQVPQQMGRNGQMGQMGQNQMQQQQIHQQPQVNQIQQRQQQQQQQMMPDGLDAHSFCGNNAACYEAISGKQVKEVSSEYSFLDGKDPKDEIDIRAATMQESDNKRSAGMEQRFNQLQASRGMDNNQAQLNFNASR